MVVRCKHDWNPGRTVTNPVLHAERFIPSGRAPMVRCADFYAKCEREGPDWCEKCPEAVRLIENYMDLVSELADRGVPKETTNVGLSEWAARPLFSIRDEEKRAKAISSVEKCLKSKKDAGTGRFAKKPKVTKSDVEKIINNIDREERRAELVAKAEEVAALPDTIQVHHLDFLTNYHILGAESVDCIITDPPYVKEWLGNFEAFAAAAEHVLKPGGFLITYLGHIHLDQIMAQMTPYLDYYWLAVLKHAGTTAAVHSRSVTCGYKPILILQKAPKTKPKRYFCDVILGTGREKDAHEWQQGEEELRQLFEPFTDPGDVVLDPFMGSGTTIAMAKKLNRRAIGFDIDGDNVAIVTARVSV
jgi:hypothetical protein